MHRFPQEWNGGGGSHTQDLRNTEERVRRKLWGRHGEREVEALCLIHTGRVKGVWRWQTYEPIRQSLLLLLLFNSRAMKEEQSFCATGTLSTDFDCGSKFRVGKDSQAQSCSSHTTSLSGSPSLGCLLESCQVWGRGRWDLLCERKGCRHSGRLPFGKLVGFPHTPSNTQQHFVHSSLLHSNS